MLGSESLSLELQLALIGDAPFCACSLDHVESLQDLAVWQCICKDEIRFAQSVTSDLKKLRANQRPRVLDEIRRNLAEEPTKATKHIKQLHKLVPPFEAVPPILQLQVVIGLSPFEAGGQNPLARCPRRR